MLVEVLELLAVGAGAGAGVELPMVLITIASSGTTSFTSAPDTESFSLRDSEKVFENCVAFAGSANVSSTSVASASDVVLTS